MKHWPSFEPFEEAGDSGKFLALWPSVAPDEPEEIVSAVSVEPEAPIAKSTETPAPPAVEPAGEASQPPRLRGRRFPSLLLLLSIAAHAAALVLTVHFLTQPGVEAQTDAISVEIVVDAPPEPNTDPSLAGEATRQSEKVEPETTPKAQQTEPEKVASPSPAKIRPEAKEAHPPIAETATAQEEVKEHAVAVPTPTFTLPPNPPDIKAALPAVKVPSPTLALPPTPPTIEAPKVLATQQTAEVKVPAPTLVLPDEAPKVETGQPAPATAKIANAVPAPALKLPDAAPQIPDDAEPPVALPDQAPLPASAPDQPKPVQQAEKPEPVKEHVKSSPGEQKSTERPAANHKVREHHASLPSEDASKAAKRPSSSGVGNASGRGSIASRGGASAGEKAAYAARLRSHVQRFERYPAEAERNGVTGSARIAITIDRSGRLLSSRLAGSSGSAILDDAARATAGRASPYPPPPDGIGGRTLTFAATVRFRR
ncbi:MAG: TonB family protein [Rhizobiaceae bacterium]